MPEQIQKYITNFFETSLKQLNDLWPPTSKVLIFIILVFAVQFTLTKAKSFLIKFLQKIAFKIHAGIFDFVVNKVKSLKSLFIISLSVYLISKVFVIDTTANSLLEKISFIVLSFTILGIISQAISKFLGFLLNKNQDPAEDSNLLIEQLIQNVVSAIVWVFGLIYILSGVGVDVSAVVAGLGITGLAVALACQSILKDLFASISIYLDKPFKPGDIIKIGDSYGTIEKIGFKTTRIREMDGDELIISNSNVVDQQIRNYKRMEKRRVVFLILINKEIIIQKLELIPSIVKNCIESLESLSFERVELTRIDKEGYEYEVSYLINNSSHSFYKKIHQQILLNFIKNFASEEILIISTNKT